MKVGLSLGGGASRGLAHLGVIQALVEAQIPIDVVTGVSIGGIIGSMYAAHPDIDQSIKNVGQFLTSDAFHQTRLDFIKDSKAQSNGYFHQLRRMVSTGLFFAIAATRNSFISRSIFEANLSHLVSRIDIEDCPIPFGLVVSDLFSGGYREFTKGSMFEAVLASAAIPGIFPPIQIDDRQYFDGSWLVPIPVALARSLGADVVIAIDVSPHLGDESRYQANMSGWDIQLRASEASRLELKNQCLKQADITIAIDLADIHWADFTHLDLCIEAGYRQTKAVLIDIREQISKKRFSHFFKWF